MKLLIDANLPFKLAIVMRDMGFDVIHTDNLPNKERTSDAEIRTISIEQDRIIVSKDSDFLDSHIVVGVPRKFLFISTGNLINRELFSLVGKHMPQIIDLFDNYDLIELNNEELIVHEK